MGKYRLFNLKSYQRSIGEDYDWILENATFRFNLKSKSRKLDKVDRLHCLLIFWKENRLRFTKYKTYETIGDYLGLNHATILHYVGDLKGNRLNRKVSNYWDENTFDINKYLQDGTLRKQTLK